MRWTNFMQVLIMHAWIKSPDVLGNYQIDTVKYGNCCVTAIPTASFGSVWTWRPLSRGFHVWFEGQEKHWPATLSTKLRQGWGSQGWMGASHPLGLWFISIHELDISVCIRSRTMYLYFVLPEVPCT